MPKSFAFQITPEIEVSPATAIAPMEGLTDAMLRRLLRQCGGCGLTVTEFVNCEALTREVAKTWAKTLIDPDEYPASVQIYGRRPKGLAEAAAMCEARGAQIIDLNLGCPAKKVVSGLSGSALMREPELCREIFKTVRATIKLPMTVKMRLGWNNSQINVVDIAYMAQEEGAAMVAVHGRTREEAYRGKSRWELVRPVCEKLSIPVLINGDILTREDARKALDLSGADGVMVGRGLLRNPWLLRQIDDDLADRPAFEPSLSERAAFIERYADGLEALPLSDAGKLGRFKCFIGYFTRALAYSSQMRDRVYKSQNLSSMRKALADYFAELEAAQASGIFNHLSEKTSLSERFKEGDPRRIDF